MRQPKFRGFNNKTQKWYYGFGWCEIDYTEEFLKEKSISPQAMLYTDGYPVECELTSMGQYTGLKDVNGVEIYEGDLLEHEMEIDGIYELYEASEVVYNEEYAMFCFRDDAPNNLNDDYRNLKVVGNIHANK